MHSYLKKRFKSENLALKMLNFFFPDGKDKFRFIDYFKRA